MNTLRTAVLVSSLGLVFPGISAAADAPTSASADVEAEAKVLREKGLEHFKKKEYVEAVEAFQRALALQRTAGAMAQMASALNALSRYDEALRWYETVLVEFPKASEKLRQKVQEEMKELVSKVGTIAVDGDVVRDARLFIDNREVGTLPLESPVRVVAGVHEVRAEKPGFTPIAATVEVSAGQPSVAKLVAKAREAKLEIRERHNWIVRVELDGQDVGVTPLPKIVTAGEHRVRLRGYMQPEALLLCETPDKPVAMGARMESEEKVVAVGLFETQSVELSAEDMDTSLHIDSTPKGAALWVDGHEVGKTPWEGRLPLGEHAIELRLKGFYVQKQNITLERRKQPEIGVRLDRVPELPGFWTGRRVGTAAGLGIGLLGLGLFGVTGGLAVRNATDLQASCSSNGFCPGADKDHLSETRALGNTALVGLIVGAVGIGTGAAVWFGAAPKAAKRDARERASLTVHMGLGGLSVQGRF